MYPSSPSAWQIWSWADPFPSLSKKLFYFVKKGLLQTAPKRDRRSRKGPPISFFLHHTAFDAAPLGWERPFRPMPACHRSAVLLRSLLRSVSGAAGALCTKIIEACCAQDCRLNRRPEEVLNIMRNAPQSPCARGREQSSFRCIACPAALTRCAVKCIFRNGKFFVIPQCPPSPNKKRPDKSRVRPEGHTLPVYLYLTMCAETGAKRPQSAEMTR